MPLVNRFITLESNLTAECCEMRGVPDKCMYACGKITSPETRDNALCTDYVDIILKCRRDGKIL